MIRDTPLWEQWKEEENATSQWRLEHGSSVTLVRDRHCRFSCHHHCPFFKLGLPALRLFTKTVRRTNFLGHFRLKVFIKNAACCRACFFQPSCNTLSATFSFKLRKKTWKGEIDYHEEKTQSNSDGIFWSNFAFLGPLLCNFTSPWKRK